MVPSTASAPRNAGSSAAASSTLAVKPRSKVRSVTVPCASRRALAPATCATVMVIASGTLPSTARCKVGDLPSSRSRMGWPSDRARVLPFTSRRSPVAPVSSFNARSAAPLPGNPNGAPIAPRSAMASVASAARARAPLLRASRAGEREPPAREIDALRDQRAESGPGCRRRSNERRRTASVSSRGSGDATPISPDRRECRSAARNPARPRHPDSACSSRRGNPLPPGSAARISAVTCGASIVPCSRAATSRPTTSHRAPGLQDRESATVILTVRSPASLNPSTPDAVTLPAALRAEKSVT